MDLHLHGKRALITGASKGIGAEVAVVLAEEGCHARLAARSEARLAELAARLRDEHRVEASTHVVDLRDPADVARLADEAGDVDILVNNAGDIPGGSLERVAAAAWRHAWELKVFGYIDLSRILYARMKARGHGVIINDIGAAGERLDFDYIAGTTGNAALMAFTRALGGRSVDDGIRVVGINPGPVETDRIVSLMRTRAKPCWATRNATGSSWRVHPASREPRRNLRPRVAARCKWARIEALLRNRAFAVKYASARERWRNGIPAAFPVGTYWLQRFASVPVLET